MEVGRFNTTDFDAEIGHFVCEALTQAADGPFRSGVEANASKASPRPSTREVANYAGLLCTHDGRNTRVVLSKPNTLVSTVLEFL